MRQGNISGRDDKGKSHRGKKEDVQKIDIQNPSDLKYWTQQLNCTPDQLKVAIYKVGCNVEAVAKYVKSLKHD